MVKRTVRQKDGFYHHNGMKFKEWEGSRIKVYNGTAYKTPGGLTKNQLVKNKWNRIVSRKKQMTARKEKRLEKYGYFARKGKFGFVRKTIRQSRRRR